MNADQKGPHPPLAMICVSTKQDPNQHRNPASGTQIPADLPDRPGFSPIEARPIQSFPPKTLENGDGRDEEKRREKEHKRRSKNWTRIETLKLIKLRSEMDSRFSRIGRKSELWDEISDTLRSEGVCRDAQQCRDKWEKLTASYKEVRDGVRDKEDYLFYNDLDHLFSGKQRREIEIEIGTVKSDGEETEDGDFPARKRRRAIKNAPIDETMEDLKDLLESLIERQHRFFLDVLDSMERREKKRERDRQEREERWREEDRAQRLVFQNAILLLTKKLVNDGVGVRCSSDSGVPGPENLAGGGGVAKKRSKNWKRGEVLMLIKLRTEMEGRFGKSTRRGVLWEELAGLMCAEGVNRDGKQCREKWDKLMAEFKDVTDGKRDRTDSPYFADLIATTARGSSSLHDPTDSVE
eukprot:TRINITY_DN1240_c0_g1_i1.p1 TRINITY_DN1240_c0_g1~~TRINITY_DN1240_c0_g1_i1.p1  ORF type:complete len:409 (+),score=46.08 TRINITY_DN1240_c0_g1_i1:196-1422(+)